MPAREKKTGIKSQISKESAQEQTQKSGKQKIDEIIDLISRIADSDGLFEAKELYANTKGRELAKSASIVISNLRGQGFTQGTKLRVPASEDKVFLKNFVNLASRLKRSNTKLSFQEAVQLLQENRSDKTEKSEKPEKVAKTEKVKKADKIAKSESKEKISEPRRRVNKDIEKPVVRTRSEERYKPLLDESREKVIKLEAELSAYKDMYFHLLEMWKK
jgi:hypothetical protein